MVENVVSSALSTAGQWGLAAWKWFAYGMTALIGGAIIYAVIWNVIHKKRYDHQVVIREIGLDGKPRIIGYDTGGLFINKKTSYRLFLLRKNKIGLSPDNIPYEESIATSFFGMMKTQVRIVNVLKLGLKQFRYLGRPTLATNSPIAMSYGVGDSDVAWGINTIEIAKQYEKKSMFSQLAPYIGMAFVFITVVVALYYLFVKAGFNADLLKNLAASAEKISANTAAAASGTTVIGGG